MKRMKDTKESELVRKRKRGGREGERGCEKQTEGYKKRFKNIFLTLFKFPFITTGNGNKQLVNLASAH